MKRGVPQSTSLGTADIFEPVSVPDLSTPDYPNANGTIGKESQKKYKSEWVEAELKRQTILAKLPEYRFMLKVEGVTSPLLTQLHFNVDFQDNKKAMFAAQERRARAAERLVEQKVKLVSTLVSNMGNHQELRMELSDGPDSDVKVSAGDSSAKADSVDAALHRLKSASKGPITLAHMVQNINKAVDLVITKPDGLSAISGEDDLMDWNMLPQHSGSLRYTAVYQQGLCLACAKLESVIGITWTPDELIAKGNSAGSSVTDENLNTLLATLVGYEILDNDTMVTRRYGKEFQSNALKEKHAMLLRELQRRLGGGRPSGVSRIENRPWSSWRRSLA